MCREAGLKNLQATTDIIKPLMDIFIRNFRTHSPYKARIATKSLEVSHGRDTSGWKITVSDHLFCHVLYPDSARYLSPPFIIKSFIGYGMFSGCSWMKVSFRFFKIYTVYHARTSFSAKIS